MIQIHFATVFLKSLFTRKARKRIAVLIWISVYTVIAGRLLSSQAHACDVPVFRYALERWPTDPYRAVAVETVSFTKEEMAALIKLRKKILKEGLNLRLQTMKRDAFSKSEYADRFSSQINGNSLILFYPGSSGISQSIWHGRISSKAIDQLSNCDDRDKLTKTLLGGSSAVFLLLESGDSKKDNAARILLQTKLKELNSQIKLPAKVVAADAKESAAEEINKLKSAIPFKIDFTLLTLPKSKPNQATAEILRYCLLGLEADLKQLQTEPMVFVIYGRGRALTPLIGKGINAKMIDQIAYFVTGACSCQVKSQNPGTDLLIQQNWDVAVFGKEKK